MEIIRDFLKALDDDMAQLGGFARAGDHDRFKEAAHRLKGAARMSGFPEIADIADIAEGFENDGRNGAPLEEKKVLELLTTPIQQARTTFEKAVHEQAEE